MKPQEVVERALAAAGQCQLAVEVSESSQVNLRWAVNELTTNGDTRSQQVSVVAMHPSGGTATTSGQVSAADDVGDLVARAGAAAAQATAAPDRARLVEGGTSPEWDEPVDSAAASVVAGLAGGLGAAFGRAAREGSGGVEHFGYAEHDLETTFLGTSAGTRLRHTQRQDRVEFTAKSHGRERSAWLGAAAVEVDVAEADSQLRRALTRQERHFDVAPGRRTVVLAPSAVADLMLELYWSADARSATEGRSVFSATGGGTRVGERLGAGIDLWSDPAHPGPGMACTPFEVSLAASDSSSPYDNGLPLHRTDWISDGVLRHLVTTRYSAGRSGLPVTPGIDNLTLTVGSGTGSTEDVIARTEHGLLVTCLWYNRVVDPQALLVTGLTRDGVYVIESGEIVGASGNFRFNESPVSLLGRIVAAGTEERTLAREMGDSFNRATMPALVVDDFHLSTSSEAL